VTAVRQSEVMCAKPRFFGDGDSFGDGQFSWVYLGDSIEDVVEALRCWADQETSSQCEICIRQMTDDEVAKLPEI